MESQIVQEIQKELSLIKIKQSIQKIIKNDMEIQYDKPQPSASILEWIGSKFGINYQNVKQQRRQSHNISQFFRKKSLQINNQYLKREIKRQQKKFPQLKYADFFQSKFQKMRPFFKQFPVKEAPLQFMCPISHQVMKNPTIITICGHSFQQNQLKRWIYNTPKCPICKKTCKITDLQKNYNLKAAIYRYQNDYK